jgi:hypothetical protein
MRFALSIEQLERRDMPALITPHGGPVLQNVKIEDYFLGSDWSTSTDVTPAAVDAYTQHLADSSFMDMLTAAGYGVGRGSLVKSIVDPAVLSANISDSDIQGYLTSAINDGRLDAPDANTLYAVFTEPGVQVNETVGADVSQPGVAVGGYHKSLTGQDGLLAGTTVPYAVTPYYGGTDDGFTPFNRTTEIFSHEFAEAVTDPIGGGWYVVPADGPGQEVGDVVNGENVWWDGYLVQQIGDQNGAPMDPNAVRFQTPTPLGPSGLMNVEAPVFSWQPINGADHYDLWVNDLTTGQDQVLRNQDVTGSSFTFSQTLIPGHSYEWWVRAGDSNGDASFWGPAMDFSVAPLDAPVPNAPAGAISNVAPTFSWSAVDRADHYDLWVSDLTTGQVLRNQDVNATSFTFSQSLNPGDSYCFWVRALDASNHGGPWSSALDFSETPLAVPTPLGPTGSSVTTPTFFWTEVASADHYDLWVSDLTTGQVLHNQNVTNPPVLPVAIYSFGQALTAGHSYRFWVRDFDSFGHASAWSSFMDFTAYALPAPTVNAPSFSGSGTTPTFSWSAITGAARYEVWVDDVTAGQSQVLWNANVSSTTWTPQSSVYRGDTYRIWVRAFDSAGETSGWSAAKDFSLAPLAVPGLTGPLNGSVPGGVNTTGPRPTFTWCAVTGADFYDLWVTDLTTGQNPVLRNLTISGTSYVFGQALTAGHNYRVWVRALDRAGDASAWSNPLDFSPAALDAPTPGMPSGTYVRATPPIFTWTPVSGANHYEIVVVDPSRSVSQPLLAVNVNGTVWASSYVLTTFTPYIWWVRAFDSAGNAGAWSQESEFEWIQPKVTF